MAASRSGLTSELEQINSELPITDLSSLASQSVSQLQPKLLTHLCLGYLKLAEYDSQVKERLV